VEAVRAVVRMFDDLIWIFVICGRNNFVVDCLQAAVVRKVRERGATAVEELMQGRIYFTTNK